MAARIGMQSEILQDVWSPEGHLLLHGRVFESVSALNPGDWCKSADIVAVTKNPEGAGYRVANLISGALAICIVSDGIGDVRLDGRIETLTKSEWTDTIASVDCAYCTTKSLPPPPQDAAGAKNWVHESQTHEHAIFVTAHGWFPDDKVACVTGTLTGSRFIINCRTGSVLPVER